MLRTVKIASEVSY